jgi:hypothetical protein
MSALAVLLPVVQAALGADAPGGEGLPPAKLHQGLAIALGAVPYVGLLIAIFGAALLLAMLAPNRQRLGVERLVAAPGWSFALGALVWFPVALALVAILARFGEGSNHGQGLCALFLFFSGCAGFAVCARALGERAMPEWSALAQTLIGLAALVLPLFSLVGLPVLLIAAPLGLGAWLSAKRPRPTAP